MRLNNRVYDVLKSLALVWLPALGTLYFALAAIWGLPAAEQVNGSVLAVDTFLGVVLGISTKQFNKDSNVIDGDLIVSEVDGEQYMSLGVTKESFAALPSKSTVQLNVVRKSAPAE